MAWLDAFFGKAFDNGTEIELGGGINFVAPLTVAYNPATQRLDVSFDGTAGLGLDYVATGANPATAGAVRLTEGEAITSADSTVGEVDLLRQSAGTCYVGDIASDLRLDAATYARIYVGNTEAYRFSATTFEPRGASGTRSCGTTSTRWSFVRAVAVDASSYVQVGADPAASGAVRFTNSDSAKAKTPDGSGDWTLFSWSSTSGNLFVGPGSTPSGGTQGRTYINAGTSVRLAVGGSEVAQIDGTFIRPSFDGTVANGGPSNKWSNTHSVITTTSSYRTLGTTPATAGDDRVPYSYTLQARNEGNTANVTMIELASGNCILGPGSAFSTADTGLTYVRGRAAVRLQVGGSSVVGLISTVLYPLNDNAVSCGTGSGRWSVVYAATGTINTSDAREKQDILPIDDALLDAWEDVQLAAYRWIEAVQAKGDAARVHTGAVAQQVRDALASHGIDGTRYGFLCHDVWGDGYELDLDVIAPAESAHAEAKRRADSARTAHSALAEAERYEVELPEPEDPKSKDHDDRKAAKKAAKARVTELRAKASEDPLEVTEAAEFEARQALASVAATEKLVTPAGERWGLRYDQLLIVEAAYQRRRADRIEARLDALEGKGKAK